jgi:hypothetical protein
MTATTFREAISMVPPNVPVSNFASNGAALFMNHPEGFLKSSTTIVFPAAEPELRFG